MRICVALAGIFLCSFSGESIRAQEADKPRTLPERTIPLPAGASQELRDAISNRRIPPPAPAPTTQEGWLKFQQTIDEAAAKGAIALAEELKVTYEPMKVADVDCFLATPPEISERYQDRWLVHVHGGAFVLGGGEGCLREAIWIAYACQARVLAIDYRRPPLHPFPAAIDDIVAVWKEVLKRQEAAATALFGSSAGGNLTLAATIRFKQLGLPLPGALLAGSPASDLGKIGDTWYTLEGLDPLGRYEGIIQGCFEIYVPSKDYSDPLLSPVRGDLKGFPPTILISGTRDLLLSDTVRMHRALRAAGVEADLHVFEGESHVDFGGYSTLPETLDAQREIVRFFDRHLARERGSTRRAPADDK